MEDIQRAIANGEVESVKEYYSVYSGVDGDGLHLDDAILLATVHKNSVIVDMLLKMKYESTDDVIATASVSFICRHPRIQWSSKLLCRVLSNAAATDAVHIAIILDKFTISEHIATIINSPMVWVSHLVDRYVEKYKKSRDAIDMLVDGSRNRREVFIIIVRNTLHIMSIGLLRDVAKMVGDGCMPPDLLDDIVSCRDFGRVSLGILRMHAKMHRWGRDYVDIIRSRR